MAEREPGFVISGRAHSSSWPSRVACRGVGDPTSDPAGHDHGESAVSRRYACVAVRPGAVRPSTFTV